MLSGWHLAVSKWFIIPQRVILSIMGFLAIVNAYTMRVVLSLVITELTPSNNSEIDSVKSDPNSEYDPDTGYYNWSQQLQGVILSSFYWGYIITHLPGGILAEKFGGKWTLSLGILSTAILTILTPVSIIYGHSTGLIVVRALMGLGEGTTFPALSVLLANWIPADERATLGSFVLGGGQIGTILGNALSGVLIHYYGWESVFYVFGGFGILWFVLFTFLCYSEPMTHPFISDKEKLYLEKQMEHMNRKNDLPPTPWIAILTSLPMFALIMAQVGHDWGFYAMVTDLPKYMKDVLNYNIKENGLLSALPYLFMWIVSLSSGWLCDWLVTRRIMTITFARKFFTILAAVGPAIFIVGASYTGRNGTNSVVLFTIAMGLMGTFYAGMKLNPLDLSPNYSGTIMAITNGIGAITGILVPIVVGEMTTNKSEEEWQLVFWLSFIIFIVTSIVYGIWASGEIQPWNEPDKMNNNKYKDPEMVLTTSNHTT